MLYLYIFPISKTFITNFSGTNSGFSSTTNQPLFFKVIWFGYEIFETTLSLKCEIMQ